MEQRPGLEQGALGPGALPPAFPHQRLHSRQKVPCGTWSWGCICGAGGSERHQDARVVLHNRAHLRVHASASGDLEFVYVGGRLLLIRKRISR